MVEESPRTHRLNIYNQFETDLSDLLRVDPDHVLGRQVPGTTTTASSRGRL